MFDRLRKAFFKAPPADKQAGAPSTASKGAQSQVSEWAGMQGLAYSSRGEGKGFILDGTVAGKPWRMERGRPSRDFIRGEELRARAELGVRDDVAVLIMNRHLKEELEKRAFAIYTDSLQTTVDPNLPEEMRWLAMYEEVGWDSLSTPFWKQYAILSDQKDDAIAWITPQMCDMLMGWPVPDPQRPMIMMLLRGKAYLRMLHVADNQPMVEHASALFVCACEAAVSGLSTDLSL
jgi:hypothetical protein